MKEVSDNVVALVPFFLSDGTFGIGGPGRQEGRVGRGQQRAEGVRASRGDVRGCSGAASPVPSSVLRGEVTEEK